MKQNRRKAFTIVELVIVIAVIAVLAAVLIPTFSGVIDKANDSATLQNGRNMYMEYISTDDNYSKANDNFIIEVEENKEYVVFKNGKIVNEVYTTLDEAKTGLGAGLEYILITKDDVTENVTPGTPNPDEPETPDEEEVVIHDKVIEFNQQTDYLTAYLAKPGYDGNYTISHMDGESAWKSIKPNGYDLMTSFEEAVGIEVYDEEDNLYYSDLVENKEYRVYNLIPGRTYKCIFVDEEKNPLEIYYLKATGSIRQIYTTNVDNPMKNDGGNGKYNIGQNIRDLGGWSTSNNGKVKYGKLYRSAQMSILNPQDKEFIANNLKVNRIIDLRGTGDQHYTGNEFADYDSVEFFVLPGSFTQYENVLKESSKEVAKKIFDEIIMDIDSKNILFHCTYGKDRTGTVSALILALLGVNEDDIAREFEITNMSGWEGPIKVSDRAEGAQYTLFEGLMVEIKKISGNTLQEKVFNYFLGLGYSSSELSSFIEKMVEGGTEPLKQYTIAYNLEGVSSSKNISEIFSGYPFEVELTSEYGIDRDTINITMGGEKVNYNIVGDNKISISIDSVTGDINIAAVSKSAPITINKIIDDKTIIKCSEIVSKSDGTEITYEGITTSPEISKGDNYKLVIEFLDQNNINKYYISKVSVKVGGEEYAAAWSTDAVTKTTTIEITDVLGNIEIIYYAIENAVRTAEALDSSNIYGTNVDENGNGYIDDYYISQTQNGGLCASVETANTPFVATGFMDIPWGDQESIDIYIYIDDEVGDLDCSDHCRYWLYTSKSSSANITPAININSSKIMRFADNYVKITVEANNLNAEYFRMSTKGIGESLIVSFNKPIFYNNEIPSK